MLRIIGKRLRIGNHDVYFVEFTRILQFDTLLERTDVVTDMKPPGRAVTGEDYFFHIILLLNGMNYSSTRIALFQAEILPAMNVISDASLTQRSQPLITGIMNERVYAAMKI